MIKENQKTKDSNLFGKKFEDNLMKKLNQGRNRKIQFNFHLLNPKECRFKGALIQLPWQRRSNASEAFITTSSHRGQNQVLVSQSITKEPSFSNSKDFPSQKRAIRKFVDRKLSPCSSTVTNFVFRSTTEFIASRLDKAFLPKWEKLINDEIILDVVSCLKLFF